jgi:hypothetical protein
MSKTIVMKQKILLTAVPLLLGLMTLAQSKKQGVPPPPPPPVVIEHVAPAPPSPPLPPAKAKISRQLKTTPPPPPPVVQKEIPPVAPKPAPGAPEPDSSLNNQRR